MNVTRLVLAAASFVLAATTVCFAEDAPEVVRYRLDNGLEVLLAPDHKVPKVGMSLIYRVGGMNEPAGRSGFAHLFEHLMFSGTAKYPRIDETYSAIGIQNNAFTQEDRTIFVADALASALPVLLSVEADRMANLGGEVDQHELDLQRDVVKNEMRQNVLDSAGAPGVEALRAALFPAPHPYAEAVIGSIADLDAAQLGDVKAFFDAYYVPNNAVLSLAGDFDVDAVKAMIAETFGLVPPGAEVALPTPTAPKPAVKRLDFADRLPSPIVVLGVAGPPGDSKDSAGLMLAGDLLGNYEYGVLRRELVNTGIAVNASAGWDPGRLGGRFLISATAAPGVTPDVLEAALRKTVAEFAAGPFKAEDVERARRTALFGGRLAAESMSTRAQMLATRFDLFGEKSPGLGDDPTVLAITTSEVEAAFRSVVVPEALSVLTIVPGTRGDYPDVLKASSGTAVPITAAARPVVDVPVLVASEPGRAELPPIETATLSNGIHVVHYRVPGSPQVLVAASVTGGNGNDGVGKEGLVDLMATLMSRGAGERNFEAFSKAAKDVGADITGVAGRQQTAMILSVTPEDFSAGVDLLADAVVRPRFEPEEWAALHAEAMQGLAYRQTDPSSLAYFALEEQAFPTAAGQPALEATPASVGSLTIEDVQAMHRQMFTPKAMTIYSVGAIGLDEVTTALERDFGGWSNDSVGLVGVPHPSATFSDGLKVYVTPSVGDSQAIIQLARPAPAFNDAGFVEAIAVGRLLGSDFTSRLNQVLREKRGYSYGVDAGVRSSIPSGGGLLTVTASVQADKVGASIADILVGFGSLASVPVSEQELARTVAASATATAGSVETSSGLFSLLVSAAGLGLTAEELNGRLDEIVALELPAVQAQAESMSGLDRAVIVIAGDPQSIVPQLAEIGITDVTILPPEE